jgi:Fe(3+) dicitrate transport protein
MVLDPIQILKSKNYFANLNYKFNDKTSIHFDYTYFNYAASRWFDRCHV